MKKKTKEVLLYIVFGVLTTLLSFGVQALLMWAGKKIFPIGEINSFSYNLLFGIAKATAWVIAVLFAFFTNKKWVFENRENKTGTVAWQLLVFAGGRAATFVMDYFVNLGLIHLLAAMNLTFLDGFLGLSLEDINETAAMFLSGVLVMIANYFISKFLVFRKKKND